MIKDKEEENSVKTIQFLLPPSNKRFMGYADLYSSEKTLGVYEKGFQITKLISTQDFKELLSSKKHTVFKVKTLKQYQTNPLLTIYHQVQ